MKIISWNVNGLRAVMKKGLPEFIKKEKPDILCLQETKVNDAHDILDNDYYTYWSHAEKKGYSGTAVFTKIKPLSVRYGFAEGEEKEGRITTLEFEDFFLVNVYVPNSQRGLTRLKHRKEWNKRFLDFLVGLKKQKPVICCGDFNVAHKEIDIARPKDNEKNAGFTEEERQDFTKLLASGFDDVFRLFNKNPDNYTWWSYMHNARERNIGWRIDYFIASKNISGKIKTVGIFPEVFGSDHCPISIML